MPDDQPPDPHRLDPEELMRLSPLEGQCVLLLRKIRQTERLRSKPLMQEIDRLLAQAIAPPAPPEEPPAKETTPS